MGQPRSLLPHLAVVAGILALAVAWFWLWTRSADFSAKPAEPTLPASSAPRRTVPPKLLPQPVSIDAAAAVAGPSDPAIEAQPSDGSAAGFHAVEGWPGWLCHDAGNDESDWFAQERGAATTERYAGSCSSWARAEPIQTHDFARVPPLPIAPCETLTVEIDSKLIERAASGEQVLEHPVSAFDCDRSNGEAHGQDGGTSASDWWCSDVDETRLQSLWFRIVDGPAAAVILDGSCAAWESGDLPQETSDPATSSDATTP